jgi:hypothetical protein
LRGRIKAGRTDKLPPWTKKIKGQNERSKEMNTRKDWELKGTFFECCRVLDGHCALWFGRDLPKACANLETYEIQEGQIQNIDMKGIILMFHQDGIGPTVAELMKGPGEGAAYISDNATEEQRNVLEPFIKTYMDTKWRTSLGYKFVNIDLSRENDSYRIAMPYGELEMSLAIGGDRRTPVRMENPPMPFLSNVRFANTRYWKYRDYGKNLEYHNTSGAIGDFIL